MIEGPFCNKECTQEKSKVKFRDGKTLCVCKCEFAENSYFNHLELYSKEYCLKIMENKEEDQL